MSDFLNLKQQIKNGIYIPDSIRGNTKIKDIGDNSLSFSYFSDNSSPFKALQSKTQITMTFSMGGAFGEYIGDLVGLRVKSSDDLNGISSNETQRDVKTVVAEVNTWLSNHESYLSKQREN